MLYIWCLKYLLNIWCKISAYWLPCALSVWADVSRHQWGQKITAGLRNLPIFSLEMTLFASKGSLLVLTRLMNCHTSISAKINCCKYLSRTKQKIIYHMWTEFWLNGAISSDVGKGRTVQTTTMVGQVEPAMCFANTLSHQWLSPFWSDIYHCLHCTPVTIVAIKKSSFCNHRIAHCPFGDAICSFPKDGWAKDQDLEKKQMACFLPAGVNPIAVTAVLNGGSSDGGGAR